MEEIQKNVNSVNEDASKEILVSTRCKVCELDFTESTIFKHVSHKSSCKAGYSEEEIQGFKDWKKQRDQLIRKRKPDPAKRREWYLKQKEKKFSQFSLSPEDQKQYPRNDIGKPII